MRSGTLAGAFIDAALPLDEPIQRFGVQLAVCRVPHQARPLTARSLFHLLGVGGAADHRRERILTSERTHSAQSERMARTLVLVFLHRPPAHEIVDSAQV